MRGFKWLFSFYLFFPHLTCGRGLKSTALGEKGRSWVLLLRGMWIIVPVLSFFGVLGPAWGEELHWWRSEFIVDSFLEIALKNEHSSREGGVRKWTTGIRYFLDHRVGDEDLHEQLTEMHLRHLAEITGVSVKPVACREQANLFMIFSTEQRLATDLKKDFRVGARRIDFMMRRSVCLAQFETTAQGAIRQATVIIPVDRARARA